MKTKHQQLRSMMEDLGYGRGKIYPKITQILDKAKIECVRVRLRPSNGFPNDFKLALWIYNKLKNDYQLNDLGMELHGKEYGDLKAPLSHWVMDLKLIAPGECLKQV